MNASRTTHSVSAPNQDLSGGALCSSQSDLCLSAASLFPCACILLQLEWSSPRGTEQGRENNDRETNPIYQVNLLQYLITCYFVQVKMHILWMQLPSSWPFFWVVNPLGRQTLKFLSNFLWNYTESLINSIFNSSLISQQEWFYRLVSNFLYWLLHQLTRHRVFSHVCKAAVKEY